MIEHSVSEILRNHVTLEVEGIDRMYLNVYVPQLQCDGGVAHFFRGHRGHMFASTALAAPISRDFVASIETFAKREGIQIVTFEKGQRKDDVMAKHLARFQGQEGILFIGKAQEKAYVFRTERRHHPETGLPYPWIIRSTAMVNHFYFYGVDQDFGPFFLKFCSYFPYNAKLCINGHEYVKRQLAKRAVAYEALDNGILSCKDTRQLQVICDNLSCAKIDTLLRKWLLRLPHPFTAADHRAGYRYDISILQAEFSLTQVLDRPLTGRVFFEEVIRENLDIGRPDHVQLIFGRRVRKDTPGRFRTRIITQDVTPSLHVDYKHTRIKQYHKEGLALRTETTINDTYDFAIGKRLHNLPALREIGFKANRRLLDVQRISHDCAIGEDAFRKVNQSVTVNGQRASALRFGNPRVLALLGTLVLFRLLPRGFSNQNLREHLEPLLGEAPDTISQGRMTYDLRRLRLHGLVERIRGTHRYQVTPFGLRAALFITRAYARLLRPGLSQVMPSQIPSATSRLRRLFDDLEAAMDHVVHREAFLATT